MHGTKPPFKKGLNLKDKEIGRALESLPILDSKAKFDLILVWRKLKDATELLLPSGAQENEIQYVRDAVTQAGLYLNDVGVAENSLYSEERKRILFVANNQPDLGFISELWFGDHINDPRVYKEIGRMSGFPKSSIDTYDKFTSLPDREKVKNTLALTGEQKKNLFPPELYPFSTYFYMSKENWQEELETVRKWAEEIKLVAPALYQEFLSKFKP